MPESLHYMAFICQLALRIDAVERVSFGQSGLIRGVAQAGQYDSIRGIHKQERRWDDGDSSLQ